MIFEISIAFAGNIGQAVLGGSALAGFVLLTESISLGQIA